MRFQDKGLEDEAIHNYAKERRNLSVHQQVANTAEELNKNCIYVSNAAFSGHLVS